ncbi:interferon gamma receptor 2 isoform X3 [Labeo rohita]|uniref:interferon gamma receptor 2 isoform X3 n=1 Tax=Labeo rohita TaxID=84645 RepID=UPI0021E27EB3|nr:interferon gamma receptor 2 isoform X3 [Labeo rohita]
MVRHICVGAVLMLLFDIEGTFCLNPPQDVKIVRSNLQWKSPPNAGSVLYSLQYKLGSKSDEWYNVTSHNRIDLKFYITPEFYGAIFRVRAEKGGNVSEWQDSKKVECVNVNSCVPVVKPFVKPETVCLTLSHMDESLKYEYGDHIEFDVSFWKMDNAGSKEHFITKSKNECFPKLESEQNYCFQVQYLLYENPHGNVSNQTCVFTPESPEMIKRRALLFSILTTLLVTAMCGVCIFLLFKHHKKIKKFLQPLPLEIPRHYQEFFRYGEFPLKTCPSSQSLRSYDMITVIENSNVEQKSQEEEQENKSLS